MSKSRPQETPKAAAAFYEYCLLGGDRSLAKLAQKLGKTSAYTRCLETWSSQHSWQERVHQFDTEQAEWLAKQQAAIIAEEKEKILRSGYALMHKRVQELDKLTRKLLKYTEDENLVWLPDVKGIGTGPDAERVDLIQFNAALFKEIRGCFADIASELGERVKTTKQEHTGKDGGPIEVSDVRDRVTQKIAAIKQGMQFKVEEKS